MPGSGVAIETVRNPCARWPSKATGYAREGNGFLTVQEFGGRVVLQTEQTDATKRSRLINASVVTSVFRLTRYFGMQINSVFC